MSLAVMNGNNNNTPNDQGAKVARKAALDASRDLPGNKRKLSAYHPTLGYAIPPPQPAKVARRNARERNRVKQVNCGFEVLRTHIPTAVKHKKMSKVDTLRHAVDYIQNLKRLLGEQEDSDLDESSCNNRSLCETPELKPHIQADHGLHNSQVPSSSSSYYGNHYSQYPQTPQFTHPSPQQSAVHQRPQHIQTYPESYESPSYYSGSSSSYSYNPSMPRDGSASPSSPGVYSDYGPCNSLPNSSNPTPYLTTSLDDFYNPEEDEILDAIVKWQED